MSAAAAVDLVSVDWPAAAAVGFGLKVLEDDAKAKQLRALLLLQLASSSSPCSRVAVVVVGLSSAAASAAAAATNGG